MGSISGSLLLGKFQNIDIRKMGSGNAGGTNALRSVGPIFALGTILIDIFKGYIPIVIFSLYIDTNLQLVQILIGLAAIFGHVYPIFYNFKGGKGAGTMIGVVLALFPYSVPFVFLIWIIILIFTGFVGLSTMCAGIALVVMTYLKFPETIISPFGCFSIIISLFLIYSHRENIVRMLQGKENQFTKIMLFKKND
jgi:glycerol-3-phosphate acyltransferase PlsY